MKWEKLKPIVVLTAICVIVSAALVGTYGLTKPVIDAAKAAEANAALSAVLPDGADFEEVTVTAENVTKAYKAGNGAGYVFQAQGKGFAGMITVMVGISSDGAITGTQVMEHGETPGIGDRTSRSSISARIITLRASSSSPAPPSPPRASIPLSAMPLSLTVSWPVSPSKLPPRKRSIPKPS